jgi:signal transduction histidine kinase
LKLNLTLKLLLKEVEFLARRILRTLLHCFILFDVNTPHFITVKYSHKSFSDVTCHFIHVENVVATRKDALIMMNGATTFISRILNDVLCVHEIEEGALKITKKPFHIEAIIRDAMAGTQQSAIYKHTQVVFGDGEGNSTIESTSPLLMGDQQKLLDVLTSFIENAIRRSDPLSQVTITLSKKFNDVIFPCSRLRKVMNIMSHSFSDRSGIDRSSEESRPVTRSLPPVALPHGASYFRAQNDNILRHFRTRNEGHVDDDAAGAASNPLGGRDLGLFLFPNNSVSEPRPLNSSYNCTSRSCNVEVLVIDRGERVSEDDLQGLIQPYRQIRPDLSDEGRGTGLWLVLAQEIIALHGGSVLFDSSSEEGNTFGFRVPFGIATPAEQTDADISHILNSSINQVNTADKDSSRSYSITSRQTERERKYLIVDGKLKYLKSELYLLS